MSASDASLIDTNVLVYAHDPRDQVKQAQALLVIDTLIATQRAVLSVLCLSEFFAVVTRRLPDPLTATEARAQVERFVRACRVLDLTPVAALEACRGVEQHGMSIWDALIWAVARLNQVPCVLTEDAQHGRFPGRRALPEPIRPVVWPPGAWDRALARHWLGRS
jgi:predicted nucleic acid-binding protein